MSKARLESQATNYPRKRVNSIRRIHSRLVIVVAALYSPT